MRSPILFLAVLASRLAAGESFIGKGQLRTLWDGGEHEDLGCLTDTGLWSSNEALCGTFTGTPLDGYNIKTFNLTTAAGPCGILGAQFNCGEGNQPSPFGVSPLPLSVLFFSPLIPMGLSAPTRLLDR